MNRRDYLKASMGALAATAAVPAVIRLAKAETAADRAPYIAKGLTFAEPEEANPLGVKIAAFNIVSPDLDASIRFYRDVLEYEVADQGIVPAGQSDAPGIGRPGRRYVSFIMPESTRAGVIRVLEAPPGAADNRPRPTSGPLDPGLLVMETGTRDPAESYHRLKSANTPTITPPRYYFYRNTNAGRADFDVMSYAAFGPGGEQMFITAQIKSDRQPWTFPKLHSGFGGASITSLDQRPIVEFYGKALGSKLTTQIASHQHNNNDLIGAPRGSYHTWGSLGGIGEVWQFWAAQGTVFPTSLDRKGLAMLTLRVDDIAKARKMCEAAGIKPVAEGALPLPDRTPTEGFYLRGEVGELTEIIPA